MRSSVTAVVAMRNASRTIAATLHSLLEARPAIEEIICVDDASSDSSVEEATRLMRERGAAVRIIPFASRRGPAVARNRGAEAAHTPLVLFVDSDVTLLPDTFAVLAERYAAQGRGAVVSLYCERNAAGGILSDFTTFYSAFTYHSGRVDSSSHLSSQCVLVNRDEFLQAGGFDERFRLPTVEDIELGLRLRDQGIPVTRAPAARVVHNSRYSIAKFIRNYMRKGFDFGWVMRQRRGAGLGGMGYGSLNDIASILLLGALGVALTLPGRLPDGTWMVALIVLLSCWYRFIRTAARMGWYRAPLFIALRASVLTLSSGAACAGFLRGSESPGPWHAYRPQVGSGSGQESPAP